MPDDWRNTEHRSRLETAKQLAQDATPLSCGAARHTEAARTVADSVMLEIAGERGENREMRRILDAEKSAETDRLARERHDQHEERRRSKFADEMSPSEFRSSLEERPAFRNCALRAKL